MDIDRIIEEVAREAKEESERGQKVAPDQNKIDILTLSELCELEIKGEEEQQEIYRRFLYDAENYIDSFTDSERCKDTNKEKGMFKCCHDTWADCIRSFALDYFTKYKYMHNRRRERTEGGSRLDETMLCIGLEVYETLCNKYRKVFQIYECCLFLGVSKDNMYKLNDLHSSFLKKSHSATENSLRIGAATGRGNIAGNALLLNHDYEYTRTTQVIHTSNNGHISAVDLPKLEDIQDIDVIEGTKQNQIETEL